MSPEPLSPVTVGFCIRQERLRRHLTQAAFAALVQKSRYWVLRTERGTRAVSVEDVRLCAGAFQMDLRKLLPHGTAAALTPKGGAHAVRAGV